MLRLFPFAFTIAQHRYHHGALSTAPGNTTGLFCPITASTPNALQQLSCGINAIPSIMAELDGTLGHPEEPSQGSPRESPTQDRSAAHPACYCQPRLQSVMEPTYNRKQAGCLLLVNHGLKSTPSWSRVQLWKSVVDSSWQDGQLNGLGYEPPEPPEVYLLALRLLSKDLIIP
ncbi:hypothetical protein N656DRAFT_771827 [Canariomyces notabilis]|uniref:Uncharacterized protein n=1 Tax=Canariomyces notabilis TaxID=2074819 RepID=A0AAN6QDX4_9PEZI|nr:hypothetical protein N656DRAFT_771827 [Canariomyces arenarius]